MLKKLVKWGETTLSYRPAKLADQDEWPDVVLYEDVKTGELYSTPPHNGNGWRLRINSIKRYEKLARSGKLYSPKHTGVEAAPVIDNKPTALAEHQQNATGTSISKTNS